MKKTMLFGLLLLAVSAHADTAPPLATKAKLYSGDGLTAITAESNGSVDVNVTNDIQAVVTSSLGAPIFEQSVFGGSVVDPRARTWSLLNTSDSVTAFQGGSPWTFSLPALASTSTLQSAGNTLLSSILAQLQTGQNVSVTNFPATQPVSASALPLPANAAQETGGNLAALNAKVTTTSNGIKVDSSGVVQPISGSVTVSNLPASQNVNVHDGSGASIGSTAGALNVNMTNASSANPSVSLTTQAVPLNATYAGARDTSGNLQGLRLNSGMALLTDSSATTQPVSGTISVSNLPATQPISAAALPLPSGAATETGNLAIIANKTSSLDTKIKAGQQLMANSVGVVIASNQTPITVTGTVNTTDASVGVNGAAGPGSSSQVGGQDPSGNLQPISITGAGAIQTDSSATVQPVSGSVTANAGTNLNTSALALETGGNLASLNGKTPALGQALAAGSSPVVLPAAQITALTPPTTVAVTQPTGTNLHTVVDNFPATQPVSGSVSVSNFPATQPVSGTVTANAGTNLNTSALALENGGHLASVDSKVPALGQALAAASTPVVLPAAQIITLTPPTTVTVQQPTGTNLHTVVDSGAVTANAGTGTFTVGQSTGTNLHTVVDSGSVNVGNFPTTQPVSGTVAVSNFPATQPVSGTVTANAGTNLNTSLLALESGGHLASVDTKTPALGQALSAGSVPVVLPAAQITTLTPPTTVAVTQATGTNLHAVVDSGAINVSNFPATQPVSGTVTANAGTNLNTSALALESGGNLAAINTKTPALGQALAAASVPVVLPAAQLSTLTPLSSVTVTQATGTNLHTVVDSGSVTANAGTNLNTSALALESGGNLASINTKSGTLIAQDASVTGLQVAQASTTAGQKGGLALGAVTTAAPTYTTGQSNPLSLTTAGGLRIDGSNTTQPISASALPLPTGASTSAKQPALGTSGTASSDVITVQGISGMIALKTDSSATTQPVSGTVTANAGTNLNTSALALESGGNLASINTKTPALGQALAAASVPIVLPAAQISTLTPLSSVTVTQATGTNLHAVVDSGAINVSNFPATQPVSGTVTANAGSGTFTVGQATGTNLHTVTDSGSVTSAAQSGTWTTGRTWSLLNTSDSVNAVQSGAWTTGRTWTLGAGDSVTANIGTTGGLALDTSVKNVQGSVGAGTAATNSSLSGGVFNTTPPTLTTGQQAALQLDSSANLKTRPLTAGTDTVTVQGGNTTAVKVDGSAVTQPVSGTVTANQGGAPWTQNVTQFGGTAVATGTGTSGAGIPRVTVSSDSSITNITGTVTLPTGASTSVNQSTEISSLSSINSTQTSGAQKTQTVDASGNVQPSGDTVARSIRVLPNDGTTGITVKAASTAAVATDTSEVVALSPNTALPTGANTIGSISNVSGTISLPSGASTSALQTPGNTSLASIDSKLPALGQTASLTASIPVVTPGDAFLTAQNITTQDLVSTSTSQASGQIIWTGTPTAGSAATFMNLSYANAMVIVKGTWTGSIQVETTSDNGLTWIPHTVHLIGGSVFLSGFTQSFQGTVNLSAKNGVRVRAAAPMTGTVAVTVTESSNPSTIYVANSIRIADGANTAVQTPLTVMPASTSPALANTAVVVSERPDNVGTPTEASISCGTSTTTLLAAGAAIQFLSIRNPTTSTNTIWINVTGASAVAASPSIDLAPGAEADYFAESASFLPTAQINCISGGTASSVTVTYK